MKHKKGISLLLLLFCVVFVIGVINTPQKRTIRYFNNHRTTLEEDILSTIGTGNIPLSNILWLVGELSQLQSIMAFSIHLTMSQFPFRMQMKY